MPPVGATALFHLVIDDGPRAGTYDVSSFGPADCGYLPNLDRWTAVFLGAPPLTFIQASLDDDLPGLLVSFDRNLPTFTSILPEGDVTYEIDDRGQTATLTVVSEENKADFADFSSVDFGAMELTVECLSVFRYT